MKSSVGTQPALEAAPSSNGSAKKTGPAKRRLPIAVLSLLAGLVIAAVAFVLMRPHPVAGIQASGTIEATESDLAAKVLGRLVDLRVHDGDPVRAGQVVAVLESVQPALNLDQARANVAAAEAQVRAAQAAYDLQRAQYATNLTQAQHGVRIAGARVGQASENLDIEIPATALAVHQAQAQLTAAQANYAHAQIDLARAKSLVSTGDEPRQSLDDATNAYTSAAAQLAAANDAVALAEANRRGVQVRELDVRSSRSQERQSVAQLQSVEAESDLVAQRRAQLAAARHQLVQAQAQMGIARDQVRETQIVAPYDGFVISHNFEDGDLVQPGAAVVTVGDLVHPYVYVYVSETDLPHIKLGTPADLSIDGMPNRVFHGKVTEISNTAEFTPENVQTKEERIEYLVFRIKIQFTDTTSSLKPGLPADALIHM